MSDQAAVVRTAEMLAAVAGDKQRAVGLAKEVLLSGAAALPHNGGDLVAATKAELVNAGVLVGTDVDVVAAANLLVVCDIAARLTPDPVPPPQDPRLVFAAPAGIEIADWERLGPFIIDVIRQATTTLHIGGAFWNDAGFDALNAVLVPALQTRKVITNLYVNKPDDKYRDSLNQWIARLAAAGPLTVRWFTGPKPTMLHAKFVIRDRGHGYLGTANLTSWGMDDGHVEAGVELTANQSERFVQFLEQLSASGVLA
ncbi:MAG: phospholipase D-like domain-containing protein [Acidimicrobiales bacterium]|nr:phospholipase D-like domain-containing protein [Acidimicrobiales bacterium]